MTARASRTGSDSRGRFSDPTFDERSVLSFKSGETGLEEIALGDHDDIESCCDLVPPENLSYQSFSPVSDDRAAQFLRRRNPESSHRLLIRQQKHGEISTVDLGAAVVNLLEFGPPTDVFGRPKGRHSLLTVRRLRPLARRRFRTRRPFFVLILTRKPCVRFLRRVFG